MKTIENIFVPEQSPIHKLFFSVVAELKLTDEELATVLANGGKIPAGKLLTTSSATVGDTIISNPTEGVAYTVADGAAQGILASDLIVDSDEKNYPVGVIISGVVYEDVMTSANGEAVSATNKEALAKQNILFYNVKTI